MFGECGELLHYHLLSGWLSYEVVVSIYEALCFDVAQGQVNGAPNETRTHSCRFATCEVVVPVWISSMSQIELFNNLLKIIIVIYSDHTCIV